MNKLILTVGLPRSGKSTWAKQQDLPIVSRDAIRLALHGQRFLSEAEDMVRVITTYMVKSLFLAGCKTVIVDECHVTKELRNRWISPDWEINYKYFSTPKEECLRRAEVNNDKELIPVIKSMAKIADFL